MKFDFAIIGGGVSGMSAALILAAAGRSVCLLEKSPRLAPVLRGFSHKGTRIDTGFHYSGGLGHGECLDGYFRHLGLEGLEYVYFDENGFDLFVYPNDGFEFRMPCGREKIRSALLERFPGEGGLIDAYLGFAQRVTFASPYLNFNMDGYPEDLPEPSAAPVLSEFLNRRSENSLLKGLLSVHCMLHGSSPDEVSIIQHTRITGPYYFLKTAGIRGGGEALAKAFEASLNRRGVVVRTSADTIALNFSGRVFKSATLEDGDVIEAENCVFTAHPRLLMNMIPSELFRPAYLRLLGEMRETPSASMLFGTMKNRPEFLQGRNLFLLPQKDLSPAFKSSSDLKTRPLYLSCEQEPDMDRQGAIAMMIDFPADEISDYGQYRKDRLDFVRQRLFSLCPELVGKLNFFDGATPETFRKWSNSPSGGIFGPAHRRNGSNPLPVTRLKGLFLAGQAIVAPGILGAIISAYVLGEILLGKDRLRNELRAQN